MDALIPDLPLEICGECRSAAPDHWLTSLWCYCPHRRVLCRWNRGASSWKVERGVKPRTALRILKNGLKAAERYLKVQGITMQQADAIFSNLRQKDSFVGRSDTESRIQHQGDEARGGTSRCCNR
jgi:hypothetical protein